MRGVVHALLLGVLMLGSASGVGAADGSAGSAPAAGELQKLLAEFLAGAGRNDASVHERFWADDLIYTSSSGRRIGKAEILKGVREAPPRVPDEPLTVYTAEEVRVHQYGETAVVAFRLVAKSVGTEEAEEDEREVHYYLNTGTFVRRDGRWRAVAWQATRVPDDSDDEAEEDSD